MGRNLLSQLRARVRYEVRYPSRSVTQIVAKVASRLPTRRNRIATSRSDTSCRAIAIYDLNCNPTTFDFTNFLNASEQYFLQRGLTTFHLVLVERSPQREAYLDNRNIGNELSSERWRIDNIVIPIARSYQALSSFSVVPSDEELPIGNNSILVFPPGTSQQTRPPWGKWHKDLFEYDLPPTFQGLSVHPWARDRIARWREVNNVSGPFVTVTLRSRSFDPTRNSDLGEILQFSEWADKDNLTVVVIPDTESDSALNEMREMKSAPFVSWNIYLRLAMYATANFNFFLSNGPGALVLSCRETRGILFSPVIEESQYSNLAQHRHNRLRVDDGRHVWDQGRYQYVFDHMNFANLVRETQLTKLGIST